MWNGYKVNAEEAELYVDRLAAVAASTASDLEELSTGMSKVAASANAMGVSEEQLASQLSTIISVTRQAPETVGTALKTIYSRMADIKAGIAEDSVTLGEYSGKLAGMGINVLDANKQLRDMGEVMEEVGSKWETFSREQQVGIAQIMGGARQYTMLTALFENWDQYTKTMEVAANAQGTLQQQQDIYMESTHAHLQELNAAWENLYDSVLTSDDINNTADAFTRLINLTADWVDGLGGGVGVLKQLGSLGLIVFNEQIVNGLIRVSDNLIKARHNAEILNNTLKESKVFNDAIMSSSGQNDVLNPKVAEVRQGINDVAKRIRPDQFNELQDDVSKAVAAGEEWAKAKQNYEELDAIFKRLTGDTGTFSAAVEELQTTTEESGNKAYEMQEKLNKLGSVIEAVKKFTKDGKEAFSEYSTSAIKALSEVNEANRKVLNDEASEHFQVSILELEKSFAAISKYKDLFSGIIGDEAFEKLESLKQKFEEILDEYAAASLEDDQDATSRAASGIEEVRSQYDFLMNLIQKKTKQTADVVNSSIDLQSNTAENAMNEAEQKATDLFDKLKQKLTEIKKSITLQDLSSAIGAIGALSSSVGSLTASFIKTGGASKEFFSTLLSQLPTAIMYIGTLKKLIESASGPVGWLIGAAAAVASAFTFLNTAEKALEEKRSQERQATIENAKAQAQELETVTNLQSAYEKAYSGYKEGTTSKQEMLDATRSLCEELGIEGYQTDLLSQQYEQLAGKIREAKLEKEKHAISDIGAGYQASLEEIESARPTQYENVQGAMGEVVGTRKVQRTDFTFDFNPIESEDFDKQLDIIIQKLKDAGITAELVGNQIKVTGASSAKDLMEMYDIIKDADTVMKSSDFSQANLGRSFQENFLQYFEPEKMAQASDSLNQLQQSVNKVLVEEFSGESVSSLEEYTDLIDDKVIPKMQELYTNAGIGKEDLANLFGSPEEIKQYLNGVLGDIEGFSVQATELANRTAAASKLSKTELGTEDAANQFLEGKNEETIKVIASMDFDEGQTKEAVEKQIQYAQNIAAASPERINLQVFSDISEILQSKDSLDNLTKDEQASFEQLEATLNNLPSLTKNFSNAWDEWRSISEEGSLQQIEYLNAMNQLQASNNEDALRGAENLYNTYRDELLGIRQQMADLEEKESNGALSENEAQQLDDYRERVNLLTEAMDALESKFDKPLSLAVELENVDSIIDLGDQFIDQTTKMQEAAAMIGEGFKVAAKDSEKLFDVFPELADQASVLADGTIQLNQGVVQELLGDQSAILEGDSQVKIAQIDNEIAVLEGKRQSAQFQLELARKVANGELQLNAQQIEKIGQNERSLAQFLMDLDVEETEANRIANEAMAGNADALDEVIASVSEASADNLDRAFSSAANSSKDNTNVMINNNNLLLKSIHGVAEAFMNMVLGKKGGSEVAAGAAGGSSSKTFQRADVNKDFRGADKASVTSNLPEIKDFIDQKNQEISDYNVAINQLKAIRLKILANQKQAQNAMAGASSGIGGNRKPSGSSSGKSPSKGSGGSSKKDKEKEADYIEELEDEWDIYHDINIQISQLDRELERIQERQEKLTGKDLIDNLNKQLSILEKQKEAYKSKVTLAKMEADEMKNILKNQGVTFGEDGQITNYALAMEEMLHKTNEAIARYNNLSAEQQTESEKKIVEKAKQDYEDFKSLVDAYEETINDTIPDLEDKITEALDKQIEIEIEKFKMSVDIRLDMSDAERDWNEFKRKVIDKIKDDDILGNAQAKLKDVLSYYNTAGTGTGSIQALTQQINDTLAQLKEMDNNLDKTSSAYGENRAKAMEDLKNYMDQLMEQLGSVQDLVDEIEESYLDMIDEAKKGFEEQLEDYEFVNDLIEYNKNVIGLLYGEDAYAEMDKYYDRQEENNRNQLDFLRKEADFWKEKMLAEEEGSDAWKAYKANWEDAIKNLNSTVEDSIQTIVDRYANLISKVFDDLDKKVSGGLGLDYINDEWELMKKNADEYLDDINSAFAIDKLRGKFQDAINNTTGVANQQKLNDLMQQQLGDLKTREKLTKYDVDRAEKLLDIELKRIALQDAQKNKSKMRLKRDASGNYSYQFVSDEESIVQAQQDLADAQNSLYNFDKDAYTNNLNDIYSIYTEFQDKMMELYKDNTLSDEERERKKMLLVEQYQELITAKTEQNSQIRNNLENSAFQELAKMYNTNISEFQNMVDEQKNILLGDLIPGWNDGIQQMVNKFTEEGGLIPACKDAFEALEEITKDYNQSLEEIENTGGISFDSLAQGYDKNIDLANQLRKENEDLINQFDKQISAIQEVISEVNKLADAYDEAYKSAVNASNAAYAYWQEQQAKEAAEAAKNKPTTSTGGNQNSSNSSSGSNTPVSPSEGGSSSSGGASNSGSNSNQTSSSGSSGQAESGKEVTTSNVKVGDKLIYTGGLYYYTSQGAGPAGQRNPGGTVTVENLAPKAKYPIAVMSSNSAYGWLLPNQLKKFDTGGYTGEWSDSRGKLAVLHEKELVLNSEDTQNLLRAVDIMRVITDSLDGNLSSMITGFSNNLSSITNAIANHTNNGGVQNNTFNVEFPNATNQNEIEAALKNLPNIASQKAMTKK